MSLCSVEYVCHGVKMSLDEQYTTDNIQWQDVLTQRSFVKCIYLLPAIEYDQLCIALLVK